MDGWIFPRWDKVGRRSSYTCTYNRRGLHRALNLSSCCCLASLYDILRVAGILLQRNRSNVSDLIFKRLNAAIPCLSSYR